MEGCEPECSLCWSVDRFHSERKEAEEGGMVCPLEIESHHCKTLPSLPAPCLLHSQHISKEEKTDGNEAFGGMDIRHMKA